ncbi:MAG: preprotein translocase subunit SecG [Usitatibacteraceae bacterium]
MLLNFILVVHVMLAIAIIVLVLLQHGKGADMGAAFGTGSAGSLFGSSGAANFLSRSTAVCAGFFFVTSLGLTYFYAPKSSTGIMGSGVMQTAPAKEGTVGSIPVPTSAPAVPEPQKPAPQQIPK